MIYSERTDSSDTVYSCILQRFAKSSNSIIAAANGWQFIKTIHFLPEIDKTMNIGVFFHTESLSLRTMKRGT